MERPKTQLDRVFVRPQYALHYRRAARVTWTSEARADYALLFLLGGRLPGRVHDDAFELGEDDALLLDPGVMAAARARHAEYLSLTLSPAFVLDAAARTGLVGAGASVQFRSHVVHEDARLARLARDLSAELAQAEAGQEVVVAALIEQMVVHLLRHHSNVRRSEELELSRVGLVDRRIRRAIELMHAHLNRELPLEEIAAAAFLSPFHFARLFKKLTGASPHAYLATLRVTRAQSLLAETDLSVSAVSARVGYGSPSHFTKAFRQATGLTPRAYRAALVGR
ncbi:MAG TPA: helix-turn-helix domain-containing protein [Pyrinomonadaceae bacterium]|nr:helix-turn-helix domain-containing protein [Pyrinomonadaceae bacterium]